MVSPLRLLQSNEPSKNALEIAWLRKAFSHLQSHCCIAKIFVEITSDRVQLVNRNEFTTIKFYETITAPRQDISQKLGIHVVDNTELLPCSTLRSFL